MLSLDEIAGDPIFIHDVDDGAPTGEHIAITSRCQDLVQFKLKLLFFHVWFVVGFADGHQFFGSCASALESLNHALGSDRVVTTEDGLVSFHPSDDWLDDVTPESL